MKQKKKEFNRFTAFFAIMAVIFSILGYKLFKLQILKSEYYKERANNAAITEIPDPAPRGNVVDRKGEILATSRQSYMLIYNETDDSKKYFFETMDKVFSILDKNKEEMQDDFELKVNPYRFEFKADTKESRNYQEIRFKRDRGLNESIKKKLFPNKKGDLTKEEEKEINNELLKVSPEDTYKYLVKQYKIYPQEDFKNLLQQYKEDADSAYKSIVERFNLQNATDLREKLEKYKNANKPKDAKKIYEELVNEYGIANLKYDLELERKYLIIKDTMKIQRFSGYKPVIIGGNIKKETAFIFLERLNELPGIDVTIQPLRYYPDKELGSAFLGYISKISSNVEIYREKGYDVNSDYVGVSGLESVYEDRLKGSKGGRIVKLNKQGRIIEELGRREPYPGQTLKLSIDKNMQKAAEETLDKVMDKLRSNPNQSYDGANTANATRGAAVAINVKTGGVLALASRPGYDPNIFSTPGKLTTEMYNKFFNPDLAEFGKRYIAARSLPVTLDEIFPPAGDNKSGKNVLREDRYDIYPKPFFNYATSSFVPPGSTFKPLTAIAGLEEGVLSPDERIYDNLIYTKHGYKGKSWNTSSKGAIDVREALAYSNNYFFFEVGDRLYQKGLDTLAKYAWKFGLGVDPKGNAKPSTGIEIPENFGQVFNVQSEKNISSTIHMWSLYEDLRKLKKVDKKNEYCGIDIQIQKQDSNDIKDFKSKIQDEIKKQMRYNDVQNFSSEMEKMLKELAEKTSNTNISQGDITAAVRKINEAVNAVEEEATRPGNVYNAAIGQGSDYFTPLQLANYISILVNGGIRYKIHLVDEYLDPNNNSIQKVQPEVIDKIDLQPKTVEAVKQGMYDVVSLEDGTGSGEFRDFPIKTGGKTGSATFNEKIQDKVGRTSAGVYIGFAPYDNPEIAVCVLVLDGAHGGYVAPVAKAMYEAYFKDELKKLNYNFQYVKTK